MELINRSAALVVPKEPFIEWIRSVAPKPEEVSAMMHQAARELLEADELPAEVTDFLNELEGAPRDEMPAPVENTVLLVPEDNLVDDPAEFVIARWEQVFEHELRSWCTDESRWPEDRTQEMFEEWFEIDVHPEVLDLVEQEDESAE